MATMRDYGKTAPHFYIGETGRKFRGDMAAWAIAGYLINGPSASAIGLYHLPIPTLAHHLGLPVDGASTGLQRVVDAGFCRYDPVTEYVYVPEMARFQIAEQLKLSEEPGKKHDSRIAWVVGELLAIQKVPFVADFVAKYRERYHLDAAERWPELAARLAPPVDGASTAPRRQEQEQEQEQDSSLGGGSSVAELFPRPAETTTRPRVATAAPPKAPKAKPKPVPKDHDGFAAFYAAYPRHEARADAEKAWAQTAQTRPALADLLVIVARQAATNFAGRAPDKIPLPATWLRGERWNDAIRAAALPARGMDAIAREFAELDAADAAEGGGR